MATQAEEGNSVTNLSTGDVDLLLRNLTVTAGPNAVPHPTSLRSAFLYLFTLIRAKLAQQAGASVSSAHHINMAAILSSERMTLFEERMGGLEGKIKAYEAIALSACDVAIISPLQEAEWEVVTTVFYDATALSIILQVISDHLKIEKSGSPFITACSNTVAVLQAYARGVSYKQRWWINKRQSPIQLKNAVWWKDTAKELAAIKNSELRETPSWIQLSQHLEDYSLSASISSNSHSDPADDTAAKTVKTYEKALILLGQFQLAAVWHLPGIMDRSNASRVNTDVDVYLTTLGIPPDVLAV